MDTQDSFFPGVTTLGDILSDAGYTQTLLIGSEAQFGGRKLYFQEHGNYEMEDYSYAIENGLIPSDYKVWWGYEDQKLFEFAKEKLLQLSQGDEPFNLTMLTVDTHFEDGYVCEQCPTEYDTQYSNVMACSSRQVGEFLKWIQQQDFYENTTIVISGDHPTMDSDYCAEIDPKGKVMDYEAHNYRKFDFNWNFKDLKLATSVGKDSYRVEGSISLKTLRKLGLISPEGEIRMGVYRADYFDDAGERVIWSSWIVPDAAEPDFHIPSSLGILKLENFVPLSRLK